MDSDTNISTKNNPFHHYNNIRLNNVKYVTNRTNVLLIYNLYIFLKREGLFLSLRITSGYIYKIKLSISWFYINDNMHIQHDFSLLAYNTFHVDCRARYFVSVESAADFIALIHTAEWKQSHKRLFLWSCLNMLLTSPFFDGIVVHNNIMGKEIISDEPHEIFLKVGGGEDWSKFVEWSVEQGLYGIEN